MHGSSVDAVEIDRLSGGRHRVRFEDIERHPRLAEARKVYIDHFLALYSGDPRTVRLLLEAGRFVVYILIATLTAAQDPVRRETWATVGLLKRTMLAFGLASGRQIDDIVARLRAVGFLELEPSVMDRRVRLLKPTARMHEHDRDWLVAHYVPMAVLFPQHDYGQVMCRDPHFQVLHRAAAAALRGLGSAMLQLSPEMMVFFGHAAGYPIVAALLQAAMAQTDAKHALVSYAEVGERFGVSRTQVRKLLVIAENAGLVKLHARGGQRIEILSRLWSAHDRGMSGGMYYHDVVYVAAAKQYAARAQGRLANFQG